MANFSPIATLFITTTFAAGYWVMGVVLPAWNTEHTRLDGAAHARSELSLPPKLARRVTFVMFDGLGFDPASRLDELAMFREQGVTRELVSHFPTYTGPNVTAMMTGLGPRESGVRLNGPQPGVEDLDTVARCVEDANIDVRVRGRNYPEFDFLARPTLGTDVRRGRLQLLLDWQIDRLSPTKRSLDLLYFGEVDEEGHRHGASSDAYAHAAQAGGRFVQLAAQQLDPEEDLLVIVSDHGHRAKGGHGGDEAIVHRAFLIAWGRGVKRNVVLDPRPIRDVAPTLTTALGVQTPSSNVGSPMLDLFDLDEQAFASHMREPFDQASRFGCGLDRTLGCDGVDALATELDEGRRGPDAMALLDQLAQERDARADALESGRRQTRFFVGLGVFAAFVALLRVGGSTWPRRWSGLLAPVLAIAIYLFGLFMMGYEPTLSTMTQTSIFLVDGTKASLFAAMIVTVVGRRLGWGLSTAAFLPPAGFAVMIPLWAAGGANPTEVGGPLSAPLVFLLSPIVFACGLSGLGIAVSSSVKRRRPAP